MIGTITPLGEREPKLARWIRRALLYVAAAVIAGGTLGYGLAQLGDLLPNDAPDVVLLSLLAGTALLYALHEVGVVRLPVPSSPWRVPVSWVNRSYYGSAVVWGLALGPGFPTYMPFPGYFILMAWLLIARDPSYGLLTGGLYGLGIAAPVVASGLSQFRRPDVRPNPVGFVRSALLWHPLNGIALFVFASLILQSLIAGSWNA